MSGRRRLVAVITVGGLAVVGSAQAA